MKRKGIGKRIAAIVLSITMSISMAGFQTGIVKAEENAEGTPVVETPVVEEPAEETPAEETPAEEITDDETTDDEITDDETNDDETNGDETNSDVTNDEENADEEIPEDQASDEELTPEELAEKQAAEEAALARAELLATSPEIIKEESYGDVKVTVDAPEGAFPGGTTVEITPVYQTSELVDAIDSVETTEDIAAFDITFYDIDGNEIQPRDGYTVNVSFELAADSELARDDATLQVFHVDDEQNATPVGDEIPSSSEGVEVSVEAESFSVYAVTVVQDPVEVKDEYYLTVGQTMEITKSLGHLTTRNIKVSSDSNGVNIEKAQIVDNDLLGFINTNDDVQISIKAISAGDTTVTVNYQYFKGLNWKLQKVWGTDSVSFKVHVADPQEFNLGEDLTGKSQKVNIVLGGFTVDEKNIENWFRKIFGKDPKEAFKVSYDNAEVVTAEVVGIENGYSIFDAKWAEKAAVVTVKLTPKENAAGKSDTVHLTYDVVGIGDGKQTISFQVSVGATYTVTFEDENGESIGDPQTVEHGSKAEKPADPTRKGYKFLGWYNGDEQYDFDTAVTDDLTLIAKWEKDYNAEFYLLKKVNVIPLENGGTQYSTQNYTKKDTENMVGTITKTAFVNLGDNFDVTTLNNIADAFKNVQDVITEKPTDEYLKGLKEQVLKDQGYPEEVYDNYDILWYVVKTGATAFHVDGVVYNTKATYYTLSYNANTTDPTVKVPSSMAYSDGTKVEVAAAPTREGYTFTGWNTQADGNGDSYAAGAELTLDKNTTLYAQWKKDVTTKTVVNFFIQLDNAVMDTEGDIKGRPVNLFSGSVAKSEMNKDIPISFQYAGAKDQAADADEMIRSTYLGNEEYVKDCPDDADVFANLRTDAKTLNKIKDVSALTEDNYEIYWYVVKYEDDGWHVDGVLKEKEKSQNPDGENPGGDNPGGGNNPGGDNPGGGNPGGGNPGGTTPSTNPGTTEIPDDETPLAPNPGDDVNDDTTVEPTEPTEIDDEDVPLSDGTEIGDDEVPLADLPDEEVPLADLPDEDVPLSDNPMTGDSVSVLWAVMAMLSAFGLAALFVTGKRKKEN